MSASERLGGPELKVFLAGRVALEADGTLIGEERFPHFTLSTGAGVAYTTACLTSQLD